MGILYLDETGNTGLNDVSQPYLIYGGPFVDATNWKALENDLAQIQLKYYSLIFGRIGHVSDPSKIGELSQTVDFFENFHFHASLITNRNGLWSKLSKEDNEHFKLLEEIVTTLSTNNVVFFAGAIKKSTVVGQVKDKPEYKKLLPDYFKHVDTNINDRNFMVIWDDGDVQERTLILEGLNHADLKNSIPELISAKKLPMLQLADVGLWIIQYYLKLDPSRQDDFAQQVRNLYSKLSPNLEFCKIGF